MLYCGRRSNRPSGKHGRCSHGIYVKRGEDGIVILEPGKEL